MEAKELGRKLRVARESAGLSQQAVADEMGLQRTAVTHWEAGSRSVSTLELVKLSALYHCLVSDILRPNPEKDDEDIVTVLHRKAPMSQSDGAAYEKVQRCIKLCREWAKLRRILGIENRSAGLPRYDAPTPRTPADAVAQGERVAELERNRLGINVTPIADIADLIAFQGIAVSAVELPEEISGLLLNDASIGLAILVNYPQSRSRKRFSYTHEYAHALLDRDSKITVSGAGNSSPLLEMRANAFASAFLMPKMGIFDGLRSLGKGLPSRQEQTVFNAAMGCHTETVLRSAPGSQRITFNDIIQLASLFGVSYSAIVYRLLNLHHLTHPEARKLLKQEHLSGEYLKAIARLGDSLEFEEADQRCRRLRREIVHLALEAYRRAEISRGRILELSKLLRLNGDSLLRLANSMRDE